MHAFVEFAKDFLVPGSAWFLLIACTTAAILLWWARTIRLGRLLVAAVVVAYWLMSVPLVARGLQVLQGRPSSQASLPPDPLPIVVLGNGLGGYTAAGARFELPLGQTAMNTLWGVARYRVTPGALVIASGGPQPGTPDGAPEALVIRYGLIRNGVPADHIVMEPRSSDTRGQAVETSEILKAHGQRQCVLVTSPQQMKRALDLFAAQGITALAMVAGAELWSPGTDARWWSWLVPSTAARAVSRDVIYEFIAWPYYRLRGWVH